jgi:hypothetical protein
MFIVIYAMEFLHHIILKINTAFLGTESTLSLYVFMFYLVINGWFLMRCEADHFSTSSAKVKKEWTLTSSPPYARMVCTETTCLPSINGSQPHVCDKLL